MNRLPPTALLVFLALAALAPSAAAGVEDLADAPLPHVRAGLVVSEQAAAYRVAAGDVNEGGGVEPPALPPGKYFADCVGGKLYIYNIIGVIVGRGACDGTWFEVFVVPQ